MQQADGRDEKHATLSTFVASEDMIVSQDQDGTPQDAITESRDSTGPEDIVWFSFEI